LEFCNADGLVSEIDLENPIFDLPLLLGVIVSGDADAFVAVEESWKSALPSTGVSFRRVPEWNSNDFLYAAIECLAHHLAVQQRFAGRASLDLAVYRGEFDRVQRSFSRLEEYVGRHSFQRPIEIFEYSPDVVSARGNRGSREADGVTGSVGRLLVQTLPVDSLGFSTFSLYVNAKPDAQGDLLAVRLKAIETGRVYGEWSLRGGDTQIGWVELALTHAIDEGALSLAIEVEWPSKDSGWGLALGPPHPYEEFCAEVDGNRHLGAPLSLRLFGGLPGVRVTATTTAIRPVGAPYLMAAFVPPEVCATAEQILPLPAEGKVNLVSYDQEIGCLTVHPRIGGLSVARMKILPPANAWRLSAQINLAHERASPTDFGLMVGLPRDESKDIARLDRLDEPSPYFSGWTTLDSLEAKSISVVFAFPPKEWLSVYLLTRQGPEMSPDFGWARFSRFEFNILKKSQLGEEEVLLAATATSAPIAIVPVAVSKDEAVTVGAT
jgi:hypothetical protein